MKPETAEPDWEALARYLAGESPAGEADRVRRALEKDAALARFVQQVEGAARAMDPAPVDGEAALHRVKSRFRETPVVAFPRRAFPGSVLRLAAAFVLIAGAALVWRLVRSPGRPAGAVTYATAVGRTDSIRLGDGTLAVLGPASRLVVAAGYGAPSRTVDLEGEAYFDVPHDPAHPFRVRARHAEILDLGTRFSVRAREEDVRVVVESGSVRLQDTVRRSSRALTLTAGQAGSLSRNQASPAPVQRTEADLAWLKGQLIFDNAPLTRVKEDLRRWYGLELVIADSALADRHVSARFAGESSTQVLHVLELTLGALIERRGDTAVVRAGRPVRRAP